MKYIINCKILQTYILVVEFLNENLQYESKLNQDISAAPSVISFSLTEGQIMCFLAQRAPGSLFKQAASWKTKQIVCLTFQQTCNLSFCLVGV